MRAVKDSLAVPPEIEVGKIGRPLPELMARLGVPALGGEKSGLFEHPASRYCP